MERFDVIVLGGGSAGSAAASAAAAAGARTAMVNRDELGGLCILRGCMPTKAMLASAHAMHAATELEPLGARLEGRVTADFGRVMRRRGEIVDRLQRAKVRSIEADGYEVIFGEGRFAEDGTLDVDGRRLDAERWVIATGSTPFDVDLPGLDEVPVWSSDDVMALERQPEALLVYGAGPIGLEMAQFFARLGTRVLLVNRSPLLHRFDADAGRELRAALDEEANLEIAIPGRIEGLRPDDAGLVAVVRTGDLAREWKADALLMAIGRRPLLDGLGLEHIGLEPRPEGLDHDEGMRTSNPRVFVAGDATGRYQILHLGTAEGRVAGHNAARGEIERRIDYRLRMTAIFCDPAFAQVGRTESELKADGVEFVTGTARFAETGRAITMGVRHGCWKLFAARGSGEILGSVVLGPRADDLVHLVSILMHHRATAESILHMPWYHPTLSEVMLNLARDVESRRGDGR